MDEDRHALVLGRNVRRTGGSDGTERRHLRRFQEQSIALAEPWMHLELPVGAADSMEIVEENRVCLMMPLAGEEGARQIGREVGVGNLGHVEFAEQVHGLFSAPRSNSR